MTSEDSKQRQAAVIELAKHGWTIRRTSKKGYLIMRCGCGEHRASLVKTPSNRNTFRRKMKHLISACSTLSD